MAAETLVSLLVENLVSLGLQLIGEEVKLLKDVEGEVSNLQTNLEDIQAVLEDAEKKKLSSSGVKRWVEKLEAVSYDMDNVLDEWNTKMKKGEGEDLLAPKKEVCFPMPSCFCSPKVNRLGLRRDIALKVKDLNEQLDRVAKEKDRYNLNTTTVEPPPYVPPTTSLIDEAKTFGRDEDKMNLVSKLLSHPEQGLQVISIVGMGGLGKTTLARLAFNNEEVKAHFEQRIWVCVSDPFEETKIARAIIEAIEGNAPNINELETLVQHVRKSIEGKKFLLVLDDVWTDDNNKWEQLKLAITEEAVGSRVLVTTRKEEVSRMMEVSHTIMLKKLSDEDCLLIFEGLAFRERNEEERNEDEVEQLKEIGRKIAGKSKGLPLVAKTLGSLMRYKKTKEQWEDVLRSELWNSEDIEEKLFAPFLLSYYDLSAVEKRCFSYCSVFPKDHIIQRSQLIEMWMSQGFLGHKENSMKKGHEYFEKLAMRSFFQNLEKSEYGGGIISCQMHDIVHDFAQFLTKNDCVMMEVDVIEESVKLVVDDSARHLTLVVGAVDEESARQCPALTYNEMNEKNLRTLFVVFNYECSVDTSLFLNLKCLRTLNLSRCGLEKLPESIGELIHLRYLNLFDNLLTELPGSLCNLCNLQTLNLVSCGDLGRLPEGIGKLVNLKHFYIGWCRLEGLPKGFGRLTSLQTLDALIVADDKEAYFDIGDLNKLKNLQLRDSLRIEQCRYFGNGDEAKKIDLKNKEHVAELTLDFGYLRDGHGSEDDFAILEALEPHQNVASISVWKYMGVTLSPRWMTSLKNLTHIGFILCNCETLPSLGKLPSLKSLTISSLTNVKTVGVEFLGISKSDEEVGGTERDEPLKSPMISFPNLESLCFVNMVQLKKWEGYVIASDTSLTIMPRLTTLTFNGCRRLQALPDFLETTTTLKQLTISYSEILEECCRKRTGEEWTKISHIPNINIDKGYKTIWIQKDGDVVE